MINNGMRQDRIMTKESNDAAQWPAAPDATNANRYASAGPLQRPGSAIFYCLNRIVRKIVLAVS